MLGTAPTCAACSALQGQLFSMQAAAEQSHDASQVGSVAMRLELDAADKTGARAHVAAVTMQNELELSERQLSVATTFTQRTLLEAREASREADVRQAAVAAELPLAESGNVLAPPLNAAQLHECFSRLSEAIEEAQPHLQDQVHAHHPQPHSRRVIAALLTESATLTLSTPARSQTYRELYEAALACFKAATP